MGAPVNRATTSAVIVLALVVGWGSARSERTDSLSQQQAAPCDTPEHRQFDFWIGQWDVSLANGQRAGSNVIEKKLGNCVLHERWTGASGSVGESFNVYRKDARQWHQSWVDNSGLLLMLDGEFSNGSMILSGGTTGPQSETVLNRITWTPFTADSVQQLWETSTDNGATWTVAFDGRYVRTGR
jgi:hypothetical protein